MNCIEEKLTEAIGELIDRMPTYCIAITVYIRQKVMNIPMTLRSNIGNGYP